MTSADLMTHSHPSQRGAVIGKLLRWFLVIAVFVVCLPLLGLVWYADSMLDIGFGPSTRQKSVAVPAPPVPEGSGGRAIAWGQRTGHTAPALSLMLRATDPDHWWSGMPTPSGANARTPDTNPSYAALELAWPSAGGEPAKGVLCSGEGPPFSGCQPFIARMVIHRDAPSDDMLTALANQRWSDERPLPGFWTQSRGNNSGTKVPEFAGFACTGSSSSSWRRRSVQMSEAEARLAAQLHCFMPDSSLNRIAAYLFGYEHHVFEPKCDNVGQDCQVTFLYRDRLVTVERPPHLGNNPLQRFHLLTAAWNQLARMEREAASPATAQDLLAEARVQLQSCQAVSAEMQRAVNKTPEDAPKNSSSLRNAWLALRGSCLNAAELGTRAATANPHEAAPLIAAASDALWQVEHDVERAQQSHYEALLTATANAGDATAMRALARLLGSLPPASPGTQDDPSGNARRERLIAKAKPLALNPSADSSPATHELRQALLRHLPQDILSEDRIAILRALLDETLSQAATPPRSSPHDVVDAWSAYISALWHSQRWPELHTAARSLQAAWLATPEPVNVHPNSDGAREYFVSTQLLSIYLRARSAGAGEPDTAALAEAATRRAERVFGADSSAATDVRRMCQQLLALPQPAAKPVLHTVQSLQPGTGK